MTKNFTRRKALAAGAASAGMLIGTTYSQSQDEKPSQTTHPLFLSPWSPPADLERNLTPGMTPIRLAARTSETDLNYPEDISITEMVKRIRDMGYTSTCARVNRDKRNPWLDASEPEITELKEALKTYDVTFFGMRAVENNIHPDPAERQKINRHVVEQCETAERLGGPTVTTGTGSCDPGRAIAPHKDNWTWETWKLTVKVIRQILRDTAGMKVVLAIEALNMGNINNPQAHLQLIEDVGDPRCKVTLDPVNMINLGTYFRTTELIDECFDLLGEHIVVADAKDTYVLPDRMSAYITQVPPGRGMLDYETFLVRLSRLSYPRTLLLEGLSKEQYPAAKKFIEDTAAKVGVTIYS
ncbi:sugar phosphate isomerase/epimerase family protein [Candidatus Latescibacterota bacterium]